MRTPDTLTFITGLLALGIAACGETTPTPPPNPTAKPTITSFTASKNTVAMGETVMLSYAVTNATQVTFATDAGNTFATETEASGTITTAAINANTVFVLTAQGAGGTATKSLTITVDTTGVHVVSFTASPSMVAQGEMTTLRWSTTNAKSVQLLDQNNMELTPTTPGLNGSHVVVITASPTTFKLKAISDAMTDEKSVTVTIAQPVEIHAFKVRPQVFSGASANVSVTWTTAFATSLRLTANGTPVPGFDGMVGTGTISVMVTGTTRFQLDAEGFGAPKQEVQIVGRAIGETEPNDDAMAANPIDGAGSPPEITDSADWYSVVVPAGGNLTIQVSDGMGGCTFDSGVGLYDDAGDPLVVDLNSGAPVNNGGDGRCGLINPMVATAAADLAAGTYYILVDTEDKMSVGTYSLLVAVGTPGCGNGIIEASQSETCDDRNTAAGDGCSATCGFEPLGTVNQPADMTFTGALASGGAAAYVLNMTSEAYLFATTFAPTDGLCEADTIITVYAADGSVVGRVDDLNGNRCASVDPAAHPFALLAPGRYTIVVTAYRGAAVPAFGVRIRTLGMGCGNRVTEAGETCDDGNMMAGDGCDASCHVELAGTVMGPPGMQTFNAAITPGRKFIYEIVMTAPGYIAAETGAPMIGTCTSSLSDTVLTLTSTSGDTIDGSDDIGQGNTCSAFDPLTADPVGPLVRAGHYLLELRGYNARINIPAVQTLVRLVPTGCGNNVFEPGEQCEDGNMMSGDGCSSMCRFDGANLVQESEPNDTNAQADALGNVRTATITAAGSIDGDGADVDVFMFDVTGAAANLTARTYGQPGDPTGCQGDTVMQLFNAQGNLVAENDDGPASLCSEISTTETGTAASTLAPGRYYLRINEFDSDEAIPGYLLDVRIR